MSFINRLKETFQKFNIDPSQVGVQLESEIKMASEGKLQDGTMIYSTADSWSVGADCYTMDESGNPVPMTAGEYVMEDGSKMVIDDKGFVTEIASVEEEQMSSEDLMKIIESLSEKVNALTNEKTELASQLALESDKAIKSSKEVSSLKTELSALKKSASAPSVKESKSHSLTKEKSTPAEKTYNQMTLKERILFNLHNNKVN